MMGAADLSFDAFAFIVQIEDTAFVHIRFLQKGEVKSSWM